MTLAYTRTAAQTSTLVKVIYVTRKVQADLFEIVDTYRPFSEAYAQKLIADLRVFLDEEVIDNIRLVWIKPGSSAVIAEMRYEVIAGGVGLTDDHAGGLRYDRRLEETDFSVWVFYNSRWTALGAAGQAEIRERLHFAWGPGGRLDYSNGQWTQDRTYSRDGYGLRRSQFTQL